MLRKLQAAILKRHCTRPHNDITCCTGGHPTAFTPVWLLQGLFNCYLLFIPTDQIPQIKLDMQPPHASLHGWRFKKGSPGDANLICLTNRPIGRLIHDLWNCEFSSWLIRARTFTWPPSACMVMSFTRGRVTDQGKDEWGNAAELKARSLPASFNVKNITDVLRNRTFYSV